MDCSNGCYSCGGVTGLCLPGMPTTLGGTPTPDFTALSAALVALAVFSAATFLTSWDFGLISSPPGLAFTAGLLWATYYAYHYSMPGYSYYTGSTHPWTYACSIAVGIGASLFGSAYAMPQWS